jgi:hypothetical protein
MDPPLLASRRGAASESVTTLTVGETTYLGREDGDEVGCEWWCGKRFRTLARRLYRAMQIWMRDQPLAARTEHAVCRDGRTNIR